MEDEDFGFTKRNDNILKNTDDYDAKKNDKGSNPSNTKTGETVGGHRLVMTAPLSGATGAGNTVPERPAIASSSSPASSVVSNPPNIPNVVEYHLKVKPGQTQKVSSHDNTPGSPSVEEMKKETKSCTPPNDNKKDLVSKLSRLSIDNNVFEGSTDLPQVFQVKYLGSHDARGLWGIKHTRRPVDNMVAAAKALPTNTMLPLIKLIVSPEGVALLPFEKRKQEPNFVRMYSIETISYGVQDLVYTRVFSMIVVRETENFRRVSPFECHGFVCESKHHARQLTYALAAAFELYSRTVRAQDKMAEVAGKNPKKRFAIDLRSPEEMEADLAADSEA
ncbi:uncharacterized protein LOC114871291 [Osmia bicornis bicornis]|uniref:uncharacterized protein LOC114871291 n=1 Tax=Osmia bicornis bicornis TaxID=1437191 RepID=UPI001EAE8874|nr:uncharacterized protein LOC114871291 [Osmia bicornis bicornis]XP_029032825.2 uncharacterized protein LOC114871291 [Osmia bicornis bicornis]XP_029032827.2 uncharacterized protein LOC114871291 [Osmia bicornis bicornis]XP_029032828.2 uncharacterized protein LOC114871291 [Osmia bicornis bicornis]XP_029032829.2 uncharacterized protein LOC114871291 [Osmia bicornis bicornis]XP_029032830.2 uncharacterized protein LOC114871291 [Osmia bicornis bicornis]XP_029032831.2 uncharacterized protein LOC11487